MLGTPKFINAKVLKTWLVERFTESHHNHSDNFLWQFSNQDLVQQNGQGPGVFYTCVAPKLCKEFPAQDCFSSEKLCVGGEAEENSCSSHPPPQSQSQNCIPIGFKNEGPMSCCVAERKKS